jgi:hypothetical protein
LVALEKIEQQAELTYDVSSFLPFAPQARYHLSFA